MIIKYRDLEAARLGGRTSADTCIRIVTDEQRGPKVWSQYYLHVICQGVFISYSWSPEETGSL